MKNLLIIAHCDPTFANPYRAALSDQREPWNIRDEWDVHAFVADPLPGVPGGGLSSRYAALLAEVHDLDGLLEHLHLGERSDYERIVLASWSAGYKLAWGLLDELDGHIALDSGYAPFDPDHTASDVAIRELVSFAERAQHGYVSLYFGFSDVVTPQTGPGAYADTAQVAAEVVRLAGPPSGLFEVRHFAHRPATPPETWHTDALRGWGPEFVREAIWRIESISKFPPDPCKIPSDIGVNGSFPGGFTDRFLGEALADIGQRETAGPNRSPWIDSLCDAHHVARGSSYCALAVWSWLTRAAVHEGRPLPIGGTASAKGYIAALGSRWRARAALGRVEPGTILVWHRGPPGAWTGHVGLVLEDLGDGTVRTIEANTAPPGEPEGVWKMIRRLDDPLLLGGGLP